MIVLSCLRAKYLALSANEVLAVAFWAAASSSTLIDRQTLLIEMALSTRSALPNRAGEFNKLNSASRTADSTKKY